MRFFLKIAVDWEDFMYSGNLFHTSGAALEKDLSPNVFKFYEVPQEDFFVRNEEISEFGGGGGGGGV